MKITNFNEQFYTYKILKQEDKRYLKHYYPIIKKYNLYDREELTEKRELKYEHINILWMNNPLKKEKEHLIVVISFLYKTRFEDEKDYDIKSQEYGRLLLLLKKELETYIERVLKYRISNLWVEKNESDKKFEKIYIDSDHNFGKFAIPESTDLEKLNIENFKLLYNTWLMCSNMATSHLYATISNNPDHKIDDVEIYSQPYFLSDIFDEKFLILLDTLKHNRWIGILSKPKIVPENDIKININKFIFQSFIVQCLDNAMKKHMAKFLKETIISIIKDNDKYYMEIKNNFSGISESEISQMKKKFHVGQKNIFNNYHSGIALISFKKYCEYSNLYCEYGFSDDGTINNNANKFFIVKICLAPNNMRSK
ncbi:MAG: hypothetical protein LBH25_10040 [Fibromonadaceae bacterium]|jgi:hypothetical protein|nr:hypothetical protein [Fibromonadaceae bacterium]